MEPQGGGYSTRGWLEPYRSFANEPSAWQAEQSREMTDAELIESVYVFGHEKPVQHPECCSPCSVLFSSSMDVAAGAGAATPASLVHWTDGCVFSWNPFISPVSPSSPERRSGRAGRRCGWRSGGGHPIPHVCMLVRDSSYPFRPQTQSLSRRGTSHAHVLPVADASLARSPPPVPPPTAIQAAKGRQLLPGVTPLAFGVHSTNKWPVAHERCITPSIDHYAPCPDGGRTIRSF